MAGLMGLLGNAGLMQDLGTGLLSQSGWQSTPTTFGQAMGGAMQFANSRQGERLALENARQKIAQDKQRTQAMSQLQGLLAPPTAPILGTTPGVPMIQTPAGQAQAMGLLGQIAPEAVAQGLMAQMFQKPESPRYTSDMNEYMAISGMQPNAPGFAQGFADYLKQKAGAEADPTQAALAQTQLAQSQVELANALTERSERQNTAATDKRKTQLNLGNDLEHLMKIAERTQQLEGTILETGLPLSDFRRGAIGFTAMVQGLVGKDPAKANELTRAYDDLNKLVSDFTLDTASRFSGSALTDSKLSMMSQSFANLKASPGTNLMIVGDTINQYLDAAEIDGITDPNADKYRAFAASLLGENTEALTPSAETPSIITSGQPVSGLLGPAANVGGDVQAQIDALDAEIERLTSELRAQSGL